MKMHLVIIDPQNDFAQTTGSLYVKGAENDMSRLAKMVKRLGSKIDDIHVTLDSHHLMHVAHPIFWKNSKGQHPNPFTLITLDDVKNGNWFATVPSLHGRAVKYVEELQKNQRYVLCIWPPHCLIGTPGHNVVPELREALMEWEQTNLAIIDFVTKGSNYMTEHYSAVRADVLDAQDPSTQLNTEFIKTLMDADIILLAGEASSHCVRNTVTDTANGFNDDSYIKKMILLKDAMSPVPGFEKFEEDFINEMTARGMQISTTVDFLK